MTARDERLIRLMAWTLGWIIIAASLIGATR